MYKNKIKVHTPALLLPLRLEYLLVENNCKSRFVQLSTRPAHTFSTLYNFHNYYLLISNLVKW